VSNQDTDDFCGNCGTYLGRQPAAGGTGPRRPTAASRRPAASADYRPATTADPAAPSTAATAGFPAGDADHRPGTTAPDSPAPGSPGASSPAPGSPGSSSDPAVPEPAADAQPPAVPPPSEQPRAVRPGKPIARRPPPSPAAAAPAERGTPCPNCGTLNSPDRRFCRHCGTLLGEPAPAARPQPWWRRVRLRRLGLPAGSRWLRRVVTLGLLGALVVAGLMLAPAGRGAIEDVRDKLATPQPVSPSQVTASASVPGHPAAAAVDGVTNRYWGAPKLGDSIEFAFSRPFRLLAIVITPGASTTPDGYTRQGRPADLDVIVTSSGGHTRSLRVNLADRPGPQQTGTGISDVVRLRLVIRTAAGLTPGRHIALGEVEFFRR
jgi:hypothetical protein